MFVTLLALALVGVAHSGTVDTISTVTCANMRCSTGGCEDTPSGPKCVKPGKCPATKKGTFGICLEACSSDASCSGDEKCCSNGCGHVCLDPVTDDVTTMKPVVTSCMMMKCSAGHVCVDHVTGGRCEPVTRPGTCPLVLCAVRVNGTTKCLDTCDVDTDCKDSGHKCCNQCGCKRCVKAFNLNVGCAATLCIKGTKCVETPTGAKCVNDTVKPGDCPVMACPLIASLTKPTCTADGYCDSDADCDGSKKCCKGCNGCGKCYEPPKPPSCDDKDCKPGYECVMNQVLCVRAPCPAIPTCVVHKCYQAKQPGLCKAYFPSWYYDTNSRTCKEFVYGGCGGNDNRFTTKKLCKKACSLVMKKEYNFSYYVCK
ncbi:hypothetical protein V1264_016205 [Littorina saxatilis]|uniref:Uncharacterized protein n=1 Tax=Littorina saxatilis TaxID=31220 RepID=A0AAN9GHV6_9CAEN